MIIELNKKQIDLISEAGVVFIPNRDYTYDEIEAIDKKLGDYMIQSCFGPGFSSTEKSELAEDTITYLIRLRENLN